MTKQETKPVLALPEKAEELAVSSAVSVATETTHPPEEKCLNKHHEHHETKQQISQIKRRDCRTRKQEMPHNAYALNQ